MRFAGLDTAVRALSDVYDPGHALDLASLDQRVLDRVRDLRNQAVRQPTTSLSESINTKDAVLRVLEEAAR